MNLEGISFTITPRIQAALDELQQMIAERYPKATFEIQTGEDPIGFYLVPTVDVEDTSKVFALVVDRLIDIQVEDDLPVYVFPRQPRERILAEWREREAERRR